MDKFFAEQGKNLKVFYGFVKSLDFILVKLEVFT